MLRYIVWCLQIWQTCILINKSTKINNDYCWCQLYTNSVSSYHCGYVTLLLTATGTGNQMPEPIKSCVCSLDSRLVYIRAVRVLYMFCHALYMFYHATCESLTSGTWFTKKMPSYRYKNLHYHIEAKTKWTTFHRRHFSNLFSSMKLFKFLLKFHWSLFLGVQFTILQHWFR